MHHFDFVQNKYWHTYFQRLIYAYNTQTHEATVSIPFIMILPRESPSVETFDRLNCPSRDMQRDVAPWYMTRWFLQRSEMMRAAGSRRLCATHGLCKRYSDSNLWQELTFKAKYYIFVNRLPYVAIVSNAADEIANRRCSKLLCRSFGPHKALNFQSFTATIDKT